MFRIYGGNEDALIYSFLSGVTVPKMGPETEKPATALARDDRLDW